MFKLLLKKKIFSGSSRTVLKEVPKDRPFPAVSRGMTFIELIVVIGIFATISGIVLFNFTGFSTNISLQNLANQIALQLKKAQTEALSGAGGAALFSDNCPLNPCRPSYGIHFAIANPSHFYHFADKDNNGQINDISFCSQNSECLDDITIQTGDRISNLVAGCDASALDITFKRPFPDALFYADGNSRPNVPKVDIVITSPKGAQKTIVVSSTGQIEIKNGQILDKDPSQCA